MYFLDSNSMVKLNMVSFSDFSHLIMLFIAIAVIFYMVFLVKSKGSSRFMTDENLMETIWTVAPCFVLISLAMPSLLLLYVTDNPANLANNLNVTGRQWYWVYSSSNFSFESYMTSSLPRLLNVDNSALISGSTLALISSGDVLHSWALPSLGVKADAVPGRINFAILDPLLKGVFFGQCSEICGANHSFMPIKLESL